MSKTLEAFTARENTKIRGRVKRGSENEGGRVCPRWAGFFFRKKKPELTNYRPGCARVRNRGSGDIILRLTEP